MEYISGLTIGFIVFFPIIYVLASKLEAYMEKKREQKMVDNGDVLLLLDGRILRVEETKSPSGLAIVLYMDRDEESYTDLDKLNVERNLGQSSGVLSDFYTIRSVHLRLNRMNKV